MKRILFVFGWMVSALGVQAQASWGSSVADSVKCYENYNIMGSYYQTKNYVEAYPSWLELYQLCPGASENIYKFGDNILEAKIEAASPEEQDTYVRMLLKMYDDHNTYFPGSEGDVLSAKAYAFYKYYKYDSIERAVALFDEAYAVVGNDMPVAHVNYYFLSNIKQFNDTKDVDRLFFVYNNALSSLEHNYNEINLETFEIEAKADSMVAFVAMADSLRPFVAEIKAKRAEQEAAYQAALAEQANARGRKKRNQEQVSIAPPMFDPEEDKLIEIVDKADELMTKYQLDEEGYTSIDRRKLQNDEILLRNIDKVQRNIEKALSPLLTCDKLALIYSDEKFEANQDDIEWLKRAARMLQKERRDDSGEMVSCVDNPVFLKIAERLYGLEPSAQAARSMARLGVQQNDWAMAQRYFTEAIEQEEDLRKKADDYMGLAVVNNKMGAYAAAKANCLKAANLRRDWGNPYLFLATIYAKAAEDGVWGSNAVEKKAAYWAAINKLTYASSIDPEIAGKAAKLIAIYKQAVPDKSIAFQLGAKEGDVIKIGSWINETVTVKFY